MSHQRPQVSASLLGPTKGPKCRPPARDCGCGCGCGCGCCSWLVARGSPARPLARSPALLSVRPSARSPCPEAADPLVRPPVCPPVSAHPLPAYCLLATRPPSTPPSPFACWPGCYSVCQMPSDPDGWVRQLWLWLWLWLGFMARANHCKNYEFSDLSRGDKDGAYGT